MDQLRDADESVLQLISEVLPDAPVAEGAVVPAGWSISAAGVSWNDEPSISAPVLISRRARDTARGTELWHLVWFRDGIWQEHIVDREVAATARSIVELASFGAPVTSNNAADLVGFLADFEAANMAVLPTAMVSSKLGFQGSDGAGGFLWGPTLLTVRPRDSGVDESNATAVCFRGADEGDEQLAEAFHAAGDFASWKQAIVPLRRFPRVRLALYASLTAPLLAILRASNFVVDFAGPTTGGKTTALRVAASPWGNPDENGSNGKPSVIASWSGTTVWKERAPAVLDHLPFLLDDTKLANSSEDVARTIYTVTQGRGRGRGTVKGTARQDSFTTVLLSTGEQPATSFTQDGGTRVRVLTFWGSPFGATTPAIGKLVRKLNADLKLHYGHAGPWFVRCLLTNRSRWPNWRRRYNELVDHYAERAGADHLAARMAPHFASIAVVAKLAHVFLKLPWPCDDDLDDLWNELVVEIDDRPMAALRHAMSWARAHQADFYSPRHYDDQPPRGWAGRWDRPVPQGGEQYEEHLEWQWIGFVPNKLDEILREGGYEPVSTVRNWKDRGWLIGTTEADGTVRRSYRSRIAGELTWLVAVRSEAVALVDEAGA